MNSAQERQRAIIDIHYEASMLLAAYEFYWEHETSGRKELVKWQHNCVVEATMVHTRILMEFFERSRQHRGVRAEDVLCEDYGVPRTNLNISPKLRDRINTSIAHLSYVRTRLTIMERHWDFPSFIPELLVCSGRFFRHLLSNKIPIPNEITEEALENFIRSVQRWNT